MSITTKPVVSRLSLSMWLGLQMIGMAAIVLRPMAHRGLFNVAAQFRRLGGSDDLICQIHPHVQMYVSPRDAYWLCFMPRGRQYEGEIEALLERFADCDVQFVDAGANAGYWSIMASKRFGWSVVAIEAAAQTARRLRRNVALNSCANVVVRENAIAGEDGTSVPFHFDEIFHAGARIVEGGRDRSSVSHVSTITIDTALAEATPHALTILKIDVEGHEQAALDGAQKTLEGPCVVAYEEHGSQQSCPVTDRLVAQGFTILFREAGRFVPIASGEEAKDKMSHRAVGYNFVATRTPWATTRLTEP